MVSISRFWAGAHPEHPINISKMISITQSDVVGAVQGEVFALSSALSLHQALEFHQRVARSWFSAHRSCGAFPTLFPRRVWVFQPWQTSCSSDKPSDNSNLAIPNRMLQPPANITQRSDTFSAGGRCRASELTASDPTQASIDLDQQRLRSGDLFYAQCAQSSPSGRLPP